jgi:hypothetical protein
MFANIVAGLVVAIIVFAVVAIRFLSDPNNYR